MDGVKTGLETDIDCGGGMCSPCADGKMCKIGTDCLDGVCTSGSCAAATCTDGIKNGTETDVDCGGSNCYACGNGLRCGTASDCLSGICINGLCLGSQTCLNNADCSTGLCNSADPVSGCPAATDCTCAADFNRSGAAFLDYASAACPNCASATWTCRHTHGRRRD